LDQNFPNPFNPLTTISYELARAVPVKLCVYDVAGRLVRGLRDGGVEQAGRHCVEWDGRDDRGLRVASGVYIYRLEAGDLVTTRRMVLLK
jgi:flagellar hook assembly protein FlgD